MAPARIRLAGALGHEAADRRIDLLRRVAAGGSISQAARDAGVSYKAAWQAIDTLSNLAGAALVEGAVGGAGGGGARLTAEGQALLRAADAVAASRSRVIASLAPARGAPAAAWASSLGLRTSMRNVLPCTVHGIEMRGQVASVTLLLAGGQALVARITRESVELLGLVPDLAVLALCKAMAVRVSRATGKEVGGPNRIQGRASRVSRGDSGDEVSATVAPGVQLVGFAPSASGLRAGSLVMMTLDDAAVVIALPG